MKKIMFNDKYGLTAAVLKGKKTQTRRIITPQPAYSDRGGICWKGGAYGLSLRDLKEDYRNFISGTEYDKSCRRFRVGEVVAVAQSYHTIYDEFGLETMDMIVGPLKTEKGWSNKMYVKSARMPHQIRITGVRIEKLQDISDEDCLREGIEFSHKTQSYYVGYNRETGFRVWLGNTPREAYAELIDAISGEGTWASNPYVFVYDFELIR